MRHLTERMFIAIWADELADPIHQLQQRLQAADANVRWAPADQLHLTLKFLGDATLLQSASVCRATDRIADNYEPFEMELRGASAFPNLQRARTLWVGVTLGADTLGQLHEELDEAMADLRFPRESRFTAHLTIGRVRSQRNLSELHELLVAEANCEIGKILVDQLALVSSRRESEGAIYETIGRSPLGPRPQPESGTLKPENWIRPSFFEHATTLYDVRVCGRSPALFKI